MRPSLRRSLCACGTLLLLSACTAPAAPTPEEVLQEVSRVTQTLRSVRFTVRGPVKAQSLLGAMDGVVSIRGQMANEGRQISAELEFDGQAGPDVMTQVHAAADLFVAPNGEVDVKLKDLSVASDTPVLPAALEKQILGRWVQLVAGSGSAAAVVSPEPQLLRAQAQSLTVTRDRGLEQLAGQPIYHYDVALDRDKLVAFLQRAEQGGSGGFDPQALDEFLGNHTVTGELWIDPDTYYVRQLRWNIATLDPQAFRADLTVTLSDHNAVSEVPEPTDVVPLGNLPPAEPVASSSASSSAAASGATVSSSAP